uniref:Uncharacterized protein n=1 Tax=Pithovirus LCDPAC01 TaxID=2506600 RepID=A0A481YN84_9VIRU|nr:MAG: hypothetical protein LCDPAC01_02060 [Pithovirus LCDPAC01]
MDLLKAIVKICIDTKIHVVKPEIIKLLLDNSGSSDYSTDYEYNLLQTLSLLFNEEFCRIPISILNNEEKGWIVARTMDGLYHTVNLSCNIELPGNISYIIGKTGGDGHSVYNIPSGDLIAFYMMKQHKYKVYIDNKSLDKLRGLSISNHTPKTPLILDEVSNNKIEFVPRQIVTTFYKCKNVHVHNLVSPISELNIVGCSYINVTVYVPKKQTIATIDIRHSSNIKVRYIASHLYTLNQSITNCMYVLVSKV